VRSCGPRGAGGRLPGTSRAGWHELDPRRDELYYRKAREVTDAATRRGLSLVAESVPLGFLFSVACYHSHKPPHRTRRT
jgi:hypothetical protein